MMDLLEHLQPDHLDAEQRQLCDTIGIEAYRRLVRTYSGLRIYIPSCDTLIVPARDSLIRGEYNGYNARELAIKWGLSERWVMSIVEDKAAEIRRKPLDGQLDFFGGGQSP